MFMVSFAVQKLFASQTAKDKYYMMSLTCRILKNGTNEPPEQKQSHRHRKQTYDYQGEEERREKLGTGVAIYTLIYVKCMYSRFSRVRLFATMWTVGLPGSCVHGDSPGKITEAGGHTLLQGIFPTQGENPFIKEITINNKNPLYSTGNFTQYSIMTYMGKKSKRVDICIHICNIHFAVCQKLTKHCTSSILQ